MLNYIVAFCGYLFIIVCSNCSRCNYTHFTDWLVQKQRASFNFTVEPSVSVGSVRQFWTNTGLWYVVV